ncbi:pyridoxamine 5'-phosphate oxidase family protein [bacterium]|nr:pyridoxamine 5'-phosphate oxidase family protein [bacterium]
MLKKKYAVSDLTHIETIIQSATICRLGLVDDNYAYIVPLNFGYEAGSLYFHTGSRGRKIDLIRNNPRVAFEIDTDHAMKSGERACDWDMYYQSVMGRGVAFFIEDREQKQRALNIIMKQYSSERTWTFPDEKLAITTVIKVKIESVSARSHCKKGDP